MARPRKTTARAGGPDPADAAPAGPAPADDVAEITDAVLVASRVLVGVAARSLADAAGDVTLPQFRALVVLRTGGPSTLSALAEALGVNPSTATRLCDRLVRKGLVVRRSNRSDKREVGVALTAPGASIVDAVTEARRTDIARLVGSLPAAQRQPLVEALRAFAAAAGEPVTEAGPESAWSAGWAV